MYSRAGGTGARRGGPTLGGAGSLVSAELHPAYHPAAKVLVSSLRRARRPGVQLRLSTGAQSWRPALPQLEPGQLFESPCFLSLILLSCSRSAFDSGAKVAVGRYV